MHKGSNIQVGTWPQAVLGIGQEGHRRSRTEV